MIARCTAVFMIVLLIFAGVFADSPKDEYSAEKLKELAVEIHHCASCGFRSKAAKLADELKKEFGIEAALVTGEVGSFDVFLNGELVFSKSEAGRFPNRGEIVQKIEEYLEQ
jgi:selenoprotein W-related protein